MKPHIVKFVELNKYAVRRRVLGILWYEYRSVNPPYLWYTDPLIVQEYCMVFTEEEAKRLLCKGKLGPIEVIK